MEDSPVESRVLALFGLIFLWGTIYMFGRVPAILILFFHLVFCLFFEVMEFPQGINYGGYAVYWAYLIYPAQISLKRFMIPARGVV
jgi:hypothetical protein